MSYALPTGDGHPIVLDMACGVSSWGKIGTLRMYGKSIPEGWLLDDSGQPSSDPNQGGLMAPAAGPRGYGLALIMGILAGPLTGGMMPCNKTSTSSEHFFIAINIESFTDYDAYIAEVKQGIGKIHGAKTAEGFTQVYLPGEIEWNNYDKWIESGIPIHVDHLRNLASIAEKLDIDIFWEW
jgi:ureidoglycolate dehydrogenase (NAD+)